MITVACGDWDGLELPVASVKAPANKVNQIPIKLCSTLLIHWFASLCFPSILVSKLPPASGRTSAWKFLRPGTTDTYTVVRFMQRIEVVIALNSHDMPRLPRIAKICKAASASTLLVDQSQRFETCQQLNLAWQLRRFTVKPRSLPPQSEINKFQNR